MSCSRILKFYHIFTNDLAKPICCGALGSGYVLCKIHEICIVRGLRSRNVGPKIYGMIWLDKEVKNSYIFISYIENKDYYIQKNGDRPQPLVVISLYFKS